MDDDNDTKQWQIRILTGPMEGVSQVLTGRLSIGRAASSDLHLGAAGVSRQHAQIVEDEQGRHVLVDLASINGTFVDGRTIERHVLEPESSFSIVGVELRYEEAREPSGVTAPRPTVDISTLRSTSELRYCEAKTVDYPTIQRLRERCRSGAKTPPAPKALSDSGRRSFRFKTPDGGEYEDDLVEDIIEYRSLRSQRLRGGLAEPSLRDRLDQLRDRLHQPPSSDPRIAQRAFCRFGCGIEARLRRSDGHESSCHMRDLGVDGAQLVVEGHDLEPETIVWLTIEARGEDRSRAVVLTGRVAWTNDEFLGVVFTGEPDRLQNCYAERPGPDNQDQLTNFVKPDRLHLSAVDEPS